MRDTDRKRTLEELRITPTRCYSIRPVSIIRGVAVAPVFSTQPSVAFVSSLVRRLMANVIMSESGMRGYTGQ